MRLKVLACALSVFFLATNIIGVTEPARAEDAVQEESPRVINAVDVRGNQLINTTTILNKLKSRAGAPLRQETINEDLKRLYGTGFFQDIKIEYVQEADGFRLIVVVDEKPVVKAITILGGKQFKEEKLRKEIALVEGQILDPKLIKDGVVAIRNKYSEKGFKFVKVDWDMNVDQAAKQATVTITIDEGVKYNIKKVRLEGVQTFKEKKVKKLMRTQRKKYFFLGGIFDEEKFKVDLDRIKAYYQERGFLDVRVDSDFEYDEADQKMTVVVRVAEGERYITGNVQIEGNLFFPKSDVWQVLKMLPDTTYSQKYLVDDVDQIRDYYYERGYIDVRILPETELNQKTGRIDVVYRIREGDLFFVDKVKVRGNTKTKDIVIRREIRIRPGERFDGAKLKRSVERLQNLGYFDEVRYETEPGADPNRKDVIFYVKERQTGELSFGAGVSSLEQFLGFAEIAQRNFDLTNWPRFTGGGQRVALKARLGSLSRDFDFSFVEPYIFNKPISFGFNLYNVTRFANNVDYDEVRTGAAINLSKALTEYVRSGVGYTLEQVTLEDLESDAAAVVRKFEGDTLLSRFRWNISRDTRNNVFNPMSGSVASFAIELIGGPLGGDESYYITNINWTKYYSFRKGHVIETKLHLGIADEFSGSDTVPVFDRFFAGGLGSVRGFGPRRVGPLEGGDAIGGQTLGVINIEYTWPIVERFKAAFFVDAATVNADSYKLSLSELSASVGPGLKMKTPIGPLAFYYGYPIKNEDEENQNGRFEFSISRSF